MAGPLLTQFSLLYTYRGILWLRSQLHKWALKNFRISFSLLSKVIWQSEAEHWPLSFSCIPGVDSFNYPDHHPSQTDTQKRKTTVKYFKKYYPPYTNISPVCHFKILLVFIYRHFELLWDSLTEQGEQTVISGVLHLHSLLSWMLTPTSFLSPYLLSSGLCSNATFTKGHSWPFYLK